MATVEVGPIVQGVHLVNPHRGQARRGRLDGVEDGHRLAVGQRHDHVGPRDEVVEDGLRAPGRGEGALMLGCRWSRTLAPGPEGEPSAPWWRPVLATAPHPSEAGQRSRCGWWCGNTAD